MSERVFAQRRVCTQPGAPASFYDLKRRHSVSSSCQIDAHHDHSMAILANEICPQANLYKEKTRVIDDCSSTRLWCPAHRRMVDRPGITRVGPGISPRTSF